jgi:predicted amidophosphoribosyltransferase
MRYPPNQPKPECRYCGDEVEYFGDLCKGCAGEGRQASLFEVIARVDLDRLEAQADPEWVRGGDS